MRFVSFCVKRPMDMPRFYLITPRVSDWRSYPSLLDEAFAVCGVACVLLRTAVQDGIERENVVRALCPLVQDHGAACLIDGHPELALSANTDGVHIWEAGASLQAALRALKPGKIVGAGGLKTRHEAMIAGEAGADYVMFGGPELNEPQHAIVENAAWWAELFTVPCVGYAHELQAIGALARAGAEFIALCGAAFGDPRGTGAALREAARIAAEAQEAA